MSLGNPHFSLDELSRTAALCQDRRKADNVSLVITCGRDLYRQAEAAGVIVALSAAALMAQEYVNSELPFHKVARDERDRLLAWYHPEKNLGYDKVLRLAAENGYLKRRGAMGGGYAAMVSGRPCWSGLPGVASNQPF